MHDPEIHHLGTREANCRQRRYLHVMSDLSRAPTCLHSTTRFLSICIKQTNVQHRSEEFETTSRTSSDYKLKITVHVPAMALSRTYSSKLCIMHIAINEHSGHGFLFVPMKHCSPVQIVPRMIHWLLPRSSPSTPTPSLLRPTVRPSLHNRHGFAAPLWCLPLPPDDSNNLVSP